MTAVTLSTTKADVMAAKKELQDRIPTARAIGIRLFKDMDTMARDSVLLFGAGLVIDVLAGAFSNIPLNCVTAGVAFGTALTAIALYTPFPKAIQKYRTARADDRANGRSEMPEEQIDAYREVVLAYAADRRFEKRAQTRLLNLSK